MLLSPPLRRRLSSSSARLSSSGTITNSACRSGIISSRRSTQQHILTAATSRQQQHPPSSNSTDGGPSFYPSSFPSPPLLLLNKPHHHHYAQHQQQQHFSGHHHHTHHRVLARPSALSLLRHARDLHSTPSQGPQDEEKKGGGEQPKKGSPSQSPQHPTVKAANHEDHARETIWTIPNLITLGRIASSPAISWFILQGEYKIALAGLSVAAASDWVDGYIAKNHNQASVLGGFLDPLADKVLIAALTFPLAWQGHLPMPLLVVVFGRDALLVGGSFIKRALHRPPDAPFFDTTSSATFQITPSLLSKVGCAG